MMFEKHPATQQLNINIHIHGIYMVLIRDVPDIQGISYWISRGYPTGYPVPVGYPTTFHYPVPDSQKNR